ncbi:GNAT family acetyltransferase [Bacillus cereus]|uniref:GNAT family N-acetyltransferase n=1 Tax=Bacillus mycoides TaxID=1405 RepID=UPI00077A0375|nr:GNAT family N-acetyltransferase [Bacillus mycoides]KXY27267.1 GNAT family acetyltransferase [Bacillus cereus]
MDLYITKELNSNDKNYVINLLKEYNSKFLPSDLRGKSEEIHVFLRNENGTVCGGILGEIYANWLEIHTFMMDEDIRKHGYGSKLLLEIEQVAVEKNCDFIKVDTLSFQALNFYKKHGYQVFGVIDNAGRDYQHYYLKKDLSDINV